MVKKPAPVTKSKVQEVDETAHAALGLALQANAYATFAMGIVENLFLVLKQQRVLTEAVIENMMKAVTENIDNMVPTNATHAVQKKKMQEAARTLSFALSVSAATAPQSTRTH